MTSYNNSDTICLLLTMQRQPAVATTTTTTYIVQSPENRTLWALGRADSKKASDTCHGMSLASGKPCRRPLIAMRTGNVVADRYCYQHKDQAADAVAAKEYARIGGLDMPRMPLAHTAESQLIMIQQKVQSRQQQQQQQQQQLQLQLQQPARPMHFRAKPSVDAGLAPAAVYGKLPLHSFPKTLRQKKKPSVWSRLFSCVFCYVADDPDDDDDEERWEKPPRPPERQPLPCMQTLYKPPPPSTIPLRMPPLWLTRSLQGHSVTLNLREWLNVRLSPSTQDKILAEMRAPPSSSDGPGYIYAFRIEKHTLPGAYPHSSTSSSTSTSSSHSLHMFKIGRTDNVQRRLYQWARQCAYSPFLVEYFPGASTGGSSSAARVAHVKKIERLIHLELEDICRGRMRLGECDGCGRDHIEWYGMLADSQHEAWARLRTVVIRWIYFSKILFGDA